MDKKIDYEKLRTNRTNTDWSKHEIIFKGDKHVKIWELKIPNTCIGRICFINSYGVMAVTGDYGNWIFCREFWPSYRGFVSDQYWIEKLDDNCHPTWPMLCHKSWMVNCHKSWMVNCHKSKGLEYDVTATRESIEKKISILEEEEYSKKHFEDMKKYLKNCLLYVDDELDYTYYAYRHYPGWQDHECVIFETKIPIWLQIIFDGFEEICRRYQKAEIEKKQPKT